MTEQQRKRWRAIHERGRFWTIVRFGVLPFGIPFAALITLDRHFGFVAKNSWSGFPADPYRFIFGVFFFGIIMGLYVWYSSESSSVTVARS